MPIYTDSMKDSYRITTRWDEEAKVYWAESEDIPGLVTEAPTIDALITRVMEVAPELLRENDHLVSGEYAIPITIISEHQRLLHLGV